jgi:transposase
MAKEYRRVDRDQAFLLPPSMTDWLPDDHLVWFVIAAVDRIDTMAFHAKARLGSVGRRGYDPDMLLTLFVYAMAHGVSSSRQIERLCGTDVAFRIICAGDTPDHTVLARFRRDHETALEELLTASLLLAAQLGMVRLGAVAFDGTKIAANASKDANRSEAHLRKLAQDYLGKAAATDDAEDALFGEEHRGDELPEDLTDRSRRGERISQALAEIERRKHAESEQTEAERTAAAEYVAQAGDPAGKARAGNVSKAADPVAVARARWQRERARAQTRYDTYQVKVAAAAQRGHRLPGTPTAAPDEHPTVVALHAAYQDALAAAEQPQASEQTGDQASSAHRANLTDPHSRLLKTRNGWIQGYNCQTATSDDGFIISARTTQDANDIKQFIPTMNDVTATAATLAGHVPDRADQLTVGTMIGDAGYDSHANLTAPGPDRLIANAKHRDLDHRAATDPATGPPPPDATIRERMDHRLRTEDGHALYTRRAPLVEAPNAWLKDRRGLRRGFARRGLRAAQAELSLAAAVTNLLKIATNGITATHLATS